MEGKESSLIPFVLVDIEADVDALGWPRDCRGLQTQHEGTPDHDPLRRHRILIIAYPV